GLGIAAQIALGKPEVSTVTAIELSIDVICLVAAHLADHRLTIIHADAFGWTPPKAMRWNVVWHDIWDDICADNLKQIAVLHRRYGRRCDWQGSWCRAECERARQIWLRSVKGYRASTIERTSNANQELRRGTGSLHGGRSGR